jgi:hypothetical protein
VSSTDSSLEAFSESTSATVADLNKVGPALLIGTAPFDEADPPPRGDLVLLDTPFRLYDSRPGYTSAPAGPKTRLTRTARTLAVACHGTPPVPAGATAALTTIAVTQTTSSSTCSGGSPDRGLTGPRACAIDAGL